MFDVLARTYERYLVRQVILAIPGSHLFYVRSRPRDGLLFVDVNAITDAERMFMFICASQGIMSSKRSSLPRSLFKPAGNGTVSSLSWKSTCSHLLLLPTWVDPARILFYPASLGHIFSS